MWYVLAQVSADLQRERQKNAELTHRISMLEAQLRNRHVASPLHICVFAHFFIYLIYSIYIFQHCIDIVIRFCLRLLYPQINCLWRGCFPLVFFFFFIQKSYCLFMVVLYLIIASTTKGFPVWPKYKSEDNTTNKNTKKQIEWVVPYNKRVIPL